MNFAIKANCNVANWRQTKQLKHTTSRVNWAKHLRKRTTSSSCRIIVMMIEIFWTFFARFSGDEVKSKSNTWQVYEYFIGKLSAEADGNASQIELNQLRARCKGGVACVLPLAYVIFRMFLAFNCAYFDCSRWLCRNFQLKFMNRMAKWMPPIRLIPLCA